MSRAQRKRRAATQPSATQPSATQSPASAAAIDHSESNGSSARKPVISRRRLWLYRLIALLLFPLLFLALFETGLRLAGFGYSTRFFLDGSEIEIRRTWIDNPDFTRWIFPAGLEPRPKPIPFSLSQQKPADAVRIFVLGESAAMGFPDSTLNFGRILQLMLRDRYRQQEFEVVNTAMVAINSHVARQIALQSLSHDPDLLIVHLGNNEVMGPFGAAGVLGPVAPGLGFIRASLALKSTRVGQWLGWLAGRLSGTARTGEAWQGMSSFVECRVGADDPRLTRIRSHFRANLRDICRAASQRGVPVVLCTIPVNLRDCPPFGSELATDLSQSQRAEWQQRFQTGCELADQGDIDGAIAQFDSAADIDDGYAELTFRQARCFEYQGKTDEANLYYARARDLDVLRFRTDAELNQIIREVAAEFATADVVLADAESDFAAHSQFGSPGSELFLEHVHMTFAGNYRLARTVFQPAINAIGSQLDSPDNQPEITDRAACERRLGYTLHSQMKIGATIGEMYQSMPPFTFQLDNAQQAEAWRAKIESLQQQLQAGGMLASIEVCRQAAEENDEDWMLQMKLGDMLVQTRQLAAAVGHYRRVTELIRHFHASYYMLAELAAAMKQPELAESQYQMAIELNPEYVEAYLRLARMHEDQQDLIAAESVLRDLLRQQIARGPATDALGGLLFRQRRFAEAAAEFAQAVQLEPKNIEFRIHWAEAAHAKGERQQAIDRLESAKALEPDNPLVAEMLNTIRASSH